jgi:calcineurin-like phosphoesterase family protein
MNPEKIYFTADQHFFHRGILKYCPGRNCTSVEAMNEQIVEIWNSIIPKDAHVFMLGDVAFANTAKTLEILARLDGRKYLIKGNHDAGMNAHVRGMFEWVKDYHEMKVMINGTPKWINLSHYPMSSWNRSFHGSWMLHGHRHGQNEPGDGHGHILDVGVDSALIWLSEMRPFTLEDISVIMETEHKQWRNENDGD